MGGAPASSSFHSPVSGPLYKTLEEGNWGEWQWEVTQPRDMLQFTINPCPATELLSRKAPNPFPQSPLLKMGRLFILSWGWASWQEEKQNLCRDRDRDHGYPVELDILVPQEPWGSKPFIFNLHGSLSALGWGGWWEAKRWEAT